MLVIPIELVGLECFEFDRPIAIIIKTQLREIVAPDPDVEIFAPIVLDPLIQDRAAGLELLDTVGP
jgi:hypothetical protein